MANDQIPLHDAPDHFFAQEKWREFRGHFGSTREALKLISNSNGGFSALAAMLPNLNEFSVHIHRLMAAEGNALVTEFIARLIAGELVSTGFCSLSVHRVPIPGERWSDLWPNFIEDEAFGQELSFTQVCVSKLAEPRPSSNDIRDNCETWMQQRQVEGESRRKVLEDEAFKRFGMGLTTRLFDAVYTRVFHKPRGRPRKAPPKNNPQK